MKKILFITFTIVCLFSSFLISAAFTMITYRDIYSSGKASINIDIGMDADRTLHFINNTDEFYKVIEEVANDCNLELYRVSYDIYQNPSCPTTAIYTNAKVGGDFFNKISLKSGNYINTEKSSEDQFMASKQTNDLNQIGLIEQFSGSSITEVHNFVSQRDLPMTFVCSVNSSDTEVLNSFMDSLNKAGVKTNGIGSFYENSAAIDPIIVGFILILFLCVYSLFIICFLYYITSKFKYFAVSKLFGKTNMDISKNMFREMFLLFGLSQIINFVLTTICLGLYNGFSYYSKFIGIWLIIQLTIFIISLIFSTTLTYFTARKIKISQMLKNKKPVISNNVLNYVTKVIFSAVAVSIFVFGFQNVTYLLKTNSNIDKWDQTSEFAYIRNVSPIILVDGSPSPIEEYETGLALQRLFQITNDKGGVFISPNISEYIVQESPQMRATEGYQPEYGPDHKSVQINNNYLKRNPIKDINGNIVNLSDEYSQTVNLLVPEKYMEFEQDLIDRYTANLELGKYSFQDRYEHFIRGTNSENDPITHDPIPINIIYVKNDQQYFTYNPNCCKESNNEITDPVAIVKNSATFTAGDALSDMANGCYFAITEDMNHPRDSLEADLKEAGAESVARIESVYKQIDKQMYDLKNQIIIQILLMIVSLAVLIMVLLTLTTNYIEIKRELNAVEKLHGYSYLKRHWKHLITIPIFWTIMFSAISLVLTITQLTNFVSVGWIAIGSIIMMILEFGMSIPIIKIKEMKKTKDVLKGE